MTKQLSEAELEALAQGGTREVPSETAIVPREDLKPKAGVVVTESALKRAREKGNRGGKPKCFF